MQGYAILAAGGVKLVCHRLGKTGALVASTLAVYERCAGLRTRR